MAISFQPPELQAFRWERDEAGYTLLDGRLIGRGGARVPVAPGEALDGVHRAFYGLQGDDDQRLQDFANKYGLLGLDGAGAPASERIADWRLALRNLGPYVAFAHDDRELNADQPTDPIAGSKWRKSLDQRNDMFNRRAPKHMALRLARIRNTDRTALHIEPSSLLAWIWLRFAMDLTGSVQHRLCARPGCGAHFDIGLGTGHPARKKYCTDKCRALHYYHENKAEGLEVSK
jgi:hypothetical protein